MSLFRRSFSRKLPDRLLEISERIYVLDCCLSTSVMSESGYKSYLSNVVANCHPGASCMVFNFREGNQSSLLSDILMDYDMTVVDYPKHYEGYPLLPLEMIHYFLRSGESWLSLEGQKNVILMNCERGGWPVLAFMLAALLLYRKQYSGEQKTLEMVYKQAPKELFSILSPINPRASQLRYLQYITGRDLGSDWPPSDAPLVVDHLLLRNLPVFDGGKGCRPVVRLYGQDPSTTKANRSPQLLFSSLMAEEPAWQYPKEECAFVRLEVHRQVQGDVILECLHLYDDLVSEEMIFKVMFHTGFLQTNMSSLNSDEIDVPWNAKCKLPKDLKAEVLFRDSNEGPLNIAMELGDGEESRDSDSEFFEVEDIFTPMSESQEAMKVELITKDVQEKILDETFNSFIAQDQRPPLDGQNKDCTLRNGSPRWDLETEESDLSTSNEFLVEEIRNHKQTSEAIEPDLISVSKNIVVVGESQSSQDVKLEIEPKPTANSAKPKPKRNKWQEITAKTITKQRVISQWVPRTKSSSSEPPKPKAPVYKWVPKAPATSEGP